MIKKFAMASLFLLLPVYAFVTVSSAAVSLPPAPIIISPVGSGTQATAPFTFNAVPGAAGYQIWLQNITAGVGSPMTVTPSQAGCPTGTGTCTFTPATPFASGNNYAWVVAAQNAQGQGPWSSALNFTVAALPPAPAMTGPSGSGIPVTSPFTFAAVSGATGYQIWLQNTTTGVGSPMTFTPAQAYCSSGTGTCTYSPAIPLAAGNNYSWVVAAQNAMGQGPWSSAMNFSAESLPPAPAGAGPSGSGIPVTTPFTFAAVTGATGYQIWLQNNTTGVGSPVSFTPLQAGCPSGTGTCTFTPAAPFTAGNNYAWAVAAQNALGQGPWSAALNFTAVPLPPAPTGVGPSGNGIPVTTPFTFTAVSGATGYQIWLQNNTAGAGSPLNITPSQAGCTSGTGTCTYTSPTPFTTGNNYAWVVAAQNALGQGPWSPALNFTATNQTSSPPPIHFNNITSGAYPASYVTSRSTCSDCHFPSTVNTTNRHSWYSSAHAATHDLPWTVNDFKTRSGCVQCHTTTGFVAYSSGKVTAAWGNAADKTKEVLTCKGCHSDISTGVVRKVVPVAPYYEDPGYVNPDLGESNICMDCHSGRKNGKSITVLLTANTDFTNVTINNSHFMPAGGTSFGVIGYHFPGRNYAGSSPSHRQIGMGNSNNTGYNGPCVGCHKNGVFNHTFRVSAAVPICANCHGSSMTDAKLSESKAAFNNALDILRAELAAKGFVYQPESPYFTNTNWGTGQVGADTMGAAFNFLVFTLDPGAYAHNPSYAKQLILDSIDYLDNGIIDNSVESLAVPNLVSANLISQQAASSLSSYKAGTTCITCHGGTAASTAPMASNAHGAHLTGSYGPGSFLGSAISSCQTCHAYNSVQPDPQHMNGVVNLVNGACNGCHPGTVPSWSAGTRLACTSCHAASPSVLPNGVAAPYKANFTSRGHGQFAASNQCTACHDPNSSHISGVLGTTVRLFLSNDNGQCSSCHNSLVARTMSTHVLDKNASPTPSLCKSCHDVHGTTNLHMIRTVINGTPITFTNMSTGFVKTSAPYDGLCQVCHTLTNHYRAGVAETGHPTKNCLGCHTHTGTFAFKPAGNCDSCHGYPPAPPGFVSGQGNYSSARLEDYPKGGGAHTVAGHISKNARPADGWLHCAICHSNGSLNPSTHLMTPVPAQQQNVTINVDDLEKFNSSLPLDRNMYTGPLNGSGTSGKCLNTGCHFGPSPLWSK